MIGQSIRLNTSIMLSCLKAIIPEQVPAVAAISCLGHAVCLDPVCPAPRATKQIPLYHSFTRKHVQAISCCNTQNLPHFPTAVRLSQYVFYCGATQSHPSSIYVTKSCKSAIRDSCGCHVPKHAPTITCRDIAMTQHPSWLHVHVAMSCVVQTSKVIVIKYVHYTGVFIVMWDHRQILSYLHALSEISLHGYGVAITTHLQQSGLKPGRVSHRRSQYPPHHQEWQDWCLHSGCESRKMEKLSCGSLTASCRWSASPWLVCCETTPG